MKRIVFDKFYKHQHLKDQLLETGDRYLEETNDWADSYWGVDTKKGGENNLGQILMEIRQIFTEHRL